MKPTEPRGGNLKFQIPKEQKWPIRFLQYVLRADLIHQQLQDSLDEYFFPSEPAVLDLRRASDGIPVPLLTKALVELKEALEL